MHKNYRYETVDEPFCENKDFFAIASIGSMIEGWTLIIPKEHSLSMKNFYANSEFKNITEKIIPPMQKEYGNLIAFEHGSNIEGSLTACGTDHAHLHIVPFQHSLVTDLLNSNLKWEKCFPSEITKKTQNKEYLFYLDINNKINETMGYLHILDYPISQYFRKIIAKKIGKFHEADYKTFPFVKNAETTKTTLSKLIA
jgi:diadenosine tetraphosphate (Ap4A) HIT family hydrolase